MSCPSSPSTFQNRLYLDCPFDEKDEAKRLGARWDTSKRQWFIGPSTPCRTFAKWLPINYLDCPYEDKDTAKHLGAKWDASVKRWFVPANVDARLFEQWLGRATVPFDDPPRIRRIHHQQCDETVVVPLDLSTSTFAERVVVPCDGGTGIHVQNISLAGSDFPRFKDQVNQVAVSSLDYPQQAPLGPGKDSVLSEHTPFADVRLQTNSVLFANPQDVVAIPSDPAFATMDPPGLTDTRRPAFVTVTVQKNCVGTTLGTTMATDGASGALYISGFTGDSDLSRLMALSPLSVGDKVLSVNEQSCAGLTPHEVVNRISKAMGSITIAIENVGGDPTLVETMVEKDTPNTKVGLGFNVAFDDGGFVTVSSVSGLFANSFVEVGDRVVFVNGVRPRSAAAANQLIASSPRFVSVTVERRTRVVLQVDDNVNTSREPDGRKQGEVKTVIPTSKDAGCSCCTM